MFIKYIDKKKKEIVVAIPLTRPTGKIRVKTRDNIYGYGLPFASRKNPFNQKNYIEWQIGYDIEIGSKNINLTKLKDLNFQAYNGKTKALYELSEYLYYLVDLGIVQIDEIKDLKKDIENLNQDDLIERHPRCSIKRTHPYKENVNKVDFEILKIEYPQLIYKFEKYEIVAEITIREKQRAVGIQPMLYFCFPITELKSDDYPLIGRCANANEFGYFTFNRNNAFVVMRMIKIFGMLSLSHQYDIVQILDLIINKKERL